MDPARLLARIAVTALGLGLVVVGVALLALPGPGLLVVALGLAVLSWEYPALGRLARPVKARALASAQRAAASPVHYALLLASGCAMVVLGIVWGACKALPLSHPWVGGSVSVAGAVLLATTVWARHRAPGPPRTPPSGRRHSGAAWRPRRSDARHTAAPRGPLEGRGRSG